MNVEPTTHGIPDWHFPSPSSTPRSSGPEQAPFQTPKCEPSSHFLDAFYTPRVTGQQTPAATPITTADNAVGPSTSTNTSPLTPQDPQFHVNHYKEGHLPLPPVLPSHRLSSTPDSVSSSDRVRITIAAPSVHSRNSMESFQMQTPPPTRDPSARREYAGPQPGVASTPTQLYAPGPMQTPLRQEPPALQQTPQFQTPLHLSQLQYSPAMFQYPGGGPASAPALPNARFSWDVQSPSFSFANEAMVVSQHEAFGPSNPASPAYAQWQTPHLVPAPPQGGFQPPFEHPAHAPDFWTTPAISSQPSSSFNETSSFASTITTTGVDPSMLFSFASPQHTTDTSPLRPHITPQKIDTAYRQPYEHQMKESNREKELAKKVKQTHSRNSAGSASISFGRPGLQRSNTDSGARRPVLAFGDTQRGSQIIEQVERRSSPLKRHSQLSLTAIPEASRSRPKTRLVVDEDGRARTETIGAVDGSTDDRHGFEIWDDSSDDEIQVNSQRNSYGIHPEQIQKRSSKHARTGSDLDRFDPHKRPVSSASISSLTSRLETTPLGKRSSRELNFRRFSSGSFSGSLAVSNASPDKEIEMADDGTDAQAALKRIMESRPRRQERNDPQAILNAHNQRWSQASIDMTKFHAMQEQSGGFDLFTSNGSTSLSPTSGTDPEILTPSTEHSIRSNESTRCVCAATEPDGHLMIQCESCNKWLHAQCVGLDPQRLPPVYVCVFCTGTTPLARGGRIREPIRRSDPAQASPLGYKSGSLFRR